MLLEKKYNLRTIEESDLNVVLEWRNSERIRSNMYTDSIISMNEHRKWFEKIKQDQSSSFNIFEIQGTPVGVVHFYNIDRRNNKCMWGFYIGKEDLPRGSGLIMGYFGLRFAFEELGIRKISGEALAFNKASINFHKKLGFLEEGRFLKHILKNNKYEDVVSFAIFKEDWKQNKTRLKKIIEKYET
ncbi:UDP-4-amino-4,6-dideoxy-N-acetyl-beta-L-altrosamine N-acetyltransferase [Vulcanibacillus modesticaldus]|uniref:UDP-4-amino-4, 6-dideoxy-N-acetyl-beta-L-altrosamine N-acetyltransferase n=1 Tax=Vulcanibacillus modesticaldus TaxID=337097 RepID=A0A1D2YT83_9BACI|nr:UDP-4-amino-4,6-dideoxy-N-acetyl-beta-L-altrosamine N-acetyltransferase [Vulcanibacillus modesticaldus]OEF98875.1 UDP-4-amino-4,6-dideoxy-N-acetyl-beta-L-altrosamine N-acetyltransferase [Vulcanibacillus modesticaldus]